MFKIKLKDGREWAPEKTPWMDHRIRKVMQHVKNDAEVSDDRWKKMIAFAEYGPRVALFKNKYGEEPFIVTPDNYEDLCKSLMTQLIRDKWFYGEELIEAYEAILEKRCAMFWQGLDSEYLGLSLNSADLPKENFFTDKELVDRLEITKKAYAAEQRAENATQKVRLEGQRADLDKRIEKLS